MASMVNTTTQTKKPVFNWATNLASADFSALPKASNENAIFMPERYEPVQLSVTDYRKLRQDGFVKCSGLIPKQDIDDMSKHMDNVMSGTETAPGFPIIDASMSEAERVARFSRIHNAHRVHAMHERFLLHPRILDVIQQINGPDVLALQSMCFFKQPGQPGQGYHQDSYYIPTLPNTLIAAWVAISEATEENGCLRFRVGSQAEPLYPQEDNEFTHEARSLTGVFDNTTASHDDTSINQLAGVAELYPEVACPAQPGDVIFFHGNVLHRSHANRDSNSRRAFAGHYCDAGSFVPWNIGRDWEGMADGKPANDQHILARGDSYFPFAKPNFGTPCAAVEETRRPRMAGSAISMPIGDGGMMGMQKVDVVKSGD